MPPRIRDARSGASGCSTKKDEPKGVASLRKMADGGVVWIAILLPAAIAFTALYTVQPRRGGEGAGP